MKILKLTLKKEPFDVMITGEKRNEYRNNSEWMRSRLYDKMGKKRQYDLVEFTNGYGKDRPKFTVKFLGFEKIYKVNKKYSNGLVVFYPKCNNGYFKIMLGDVI